MAGQQGRLFVWSSLNRHRHESSPVGEELGDVDERGARRRGWIPLSVIYYCSILTNPALSPGSFPAAGWSVCPEHAD